MPQGDGRHSECVANSSIEGLAEVGGQRYQVDSRNQAGRRVLAHRNGPVISGVDQHLQRGLDQLHHRFDEPGRAGDRGEIADRLQQREVLRRDQDISVVPVLGVAVRILPFSGVLLHRRRGEQLCERLLAGRTPRERGVDGGRVGIGQVGVEEAEGRVESRQQIDRVQRRVGDDVVLVGDVGHPVTGVGRGRAVEGDADERDGEAVESGPDPAVGAAPVATRTTSG